MDISTHYLCEQAQKALPAVTLDQVLSTMHGIGQLIKVQLNMLKAVRLNTFGVFTLGGGKLNYGHTNFQIFFK